MELNGKLLIAMPGMGDPRFEHSVIFLCAHSDEGAMGLIVNKPSKDVDFTEILQQLSIEITPRSKTLSVHFGGPVEMARGFVLHSLDYTSSIQTLKVAGYGMTATLDVLEDIAKGEGPEQSVLALGYAGWGPGQLEAEIAQNGWLTCDVSREVVFELPDAEKWTAALASLGVDPLSLSATAGRA
nr:YqgE/AlgH family protein [Ascidiaceihabitans donghaensis]